MHEGPSQSIPAPAIQFFDSGVKTEKGEVKAGPVYGDMTKGRHGTFLRVPHGFVTPVHTHTEDYFAIVVKGIAANQKPGAPVVALIPGSYWFQKGEEAHITQCISKEDCLFFIVGSGKFDFLPKN
jgi:hypothetical protein